MPKCMFAIQYDVSVSVAPSSFSVCGRIAVSRLPEGMKQQGRYKVTLTPSGQDKAAARTTESDHMGAFCFQARPGDYSVQVTAHTGVMRL